MRAHAIAGRAAPGRRRRRARAGAGAGGDDRYRFAAGAQPRDGASVSTPRRWARGSLAGAHRARLGHGAAGRPGDAATQPSPWVDLTRGHRVACGSTSTPSARGLRWLNLTGLRGAAHGRRRRSRSRWARARPSSPRPRCALFANRLDLSRPILILAPHPDDAEIARVRLCASGRNATIVTVTSGNAGDANYAADFPDPAQQYRFKGYLRAVDSVTVPWQGGIPPERCFNLGYFDARLQGRCAGSRARWCRSCTARTTTSRVYRARERRPAAAERLAQATRGRTWSRTCSDAKKVKPAVVVMPAPVTSTTTPTTST